MYDSKKLVIIITAIIFIASISLNSIREINNTESKSTNVVQEKSETKNYNDLLNKIDKLQTEYFNVIKSYPAEVNDNDISKLFKQAKDYIPKNNSYLVLLEGIDKNYQKDNNNYEYDQFTKQDLYSLYNNKLDQLLNEIFKEIKSTIPQKDFVSLDNAQNKWEKDMNNFFKNVEQIFEGGNGGGLSILTEKYEMKKYRILLLIQYLL